MAWLAKHGVIKNWQDWAPLCQRISQWFEHWGTDVGAMEVCLSGLDAHQQPLRITWSLEATGGVGPYIPTLPALLVSEQIIQQDLGLTQRLNPIAIEPGARPCLGLFKLKDFITKAEHWGISVREVVAAI